MHSGTPQRGGGGCGQAVPAWQVRPQPDSWPWKHCHRVAYSDMPSPLSAKSSPALPIAKQANLRVARSSSLHNTMSGSRSPLRSRAE